MDDILDIFDMSKKFERVYVRGSQTQGYVEITDKDLFYDPYDIKKEKRGQEYAREYQEQEEYEVFEVRIPSYIQNETY